MGVKRTLGLCLPKLASRRTPDGQEVLVAEVDDKFFICELAFDGHLSPRFHVLSVSPRFKHDAQFDVGRISNDQATHGFGSFTA